MHRLLLVLVLFFPLAASAAEPAKVSLKSDALGKEMMFSILLPDSYKTEPDRRYQVIYVLNGWYGNGQGLFYNNAIGQRPFVQNFADEKQLILVNFGLPGDWYFDSPRDPTIRYGTFVSRELIAYVDRNYRTVARREGRAIAGFSSGGHGAFLLALQQPQTYIAAGSIFGCPDLTRYVGSKPDWKLPHVLGDFQQHPENWRQCSLQPHLKNVKGTGLGIWFGCGLKDELLPDNRKLAQQMKDLGIEHTYHEGPGGHDTQYSSAAFPVCLKEIEKHLRRE